MSQNPFLEGQDQPGRFRQSQELVRSQSPPHGVMPANERLDAGHTLCVDRNYRLIEQLELIKGQRFTQFALHRPLKIGGFGQLRFKDSEVVSASRFRRIESNIRALHQDIRIETMLRSGCYADTGAYLDTRTVKVKRLLDQRDDPERERNSALLLVLLMFLNDRELIAAESR